MLIMDESLNARRAQLLIDGELQGLIVRRVIYYWLAAIASVAMGLPISKLLWGEAISWQTLTDGLRLLGPACAIALFPLVYVIRDILKATHRFAGPMLRIRRGLSELAETGQTSLISARAGDAWADCISDFNRVAERLSESQA